MRLGAASIGSSVLAPSSSLIYTCYCMCMFEKRLQILIDEPRYRRLAAAARERRQSVSSVIREAIDVALPADLAEKQAAADAILAAEPMPVPDTIEELKAELEELYGDKL